MYELPPLAMVANSEGYHPDVKMATLTYESEMSGSMDVVLESKAEFVEELLSDTQYNVELVLTYDVDGVVFLSNPVLGKFLTLPEGEKEIERTKLGGCLIVKVSFKGQGAFNPVPPWKAMPPPTPLKIE